MWAKPSFSISREISSSVGNVSCEGGLFGRNCFSLGNRNVRMRVRISSHGKKSQLSAPITPNTTLFVKK